MLFGEKETSRGGNNLNTKEVMKKPQVFDREPRSQCDNELHYKRRIVASNNKIVNINQEINDMTAKGINK